MEHEHVTREIKPEPIAMVCNNCGQRFDISFDVFAEIIQCPACLSTATEVDVEVVRDPHVEI